MDGRTTSNISTKVKNPKVKAATKITRKVKCELVAPIHKGQDKKQSKAASGEKKETTQGVDISDLSKIDVGKNKKTTQCIDISNGVTPPRKPKHSSPVSSFSNARENVINKALGGALDKLLKLSNNDDFEVRKDRTVILTRSQVSPYIGNSCTIRTNSGVTASPAIYNPFAKVDQHKEDRLLEYVKKDLENPFEYCHAGVEFYLVIMTPKDMWPKENPTYGWLNNMHMAAAFNMFRQRSLQRPSPFKSERIAFLDPLFTGLWCQDYKREFIMAEEKWVFTLEYFNMYNGLNPSFATTNKKWVEDVDTLYIAHNIDNQHWVAVVVDLVKKKVQVYDCISSFYSNSFIYESCKAYTKMIPMLIKQATPPDQRLGMSEAAYHISMVQNIPQNKQTGDCGVYTLKYVECLALGHVMDGMSDLTMPVIRMKLAAEILDELPEKEIIQLSDPNPRERSKDKGSSSK